jgi:hypothetical protein
MVPIASSSASLGGEFYGCNDDKTLTIEGDHDFAPLTPLADVPERLARFTEWVTSIDRGHQPTFRTELGDRL